jgi:hypothetical protein
MKRIKKIFRIKTETATATPKDARIMKISHRNLKVEFAENSNRWES